LKIKRNYENKKNDIRAGMVRIDSFIPALYGRSDGICWDHEISSNAKAPLEMVGKLDKKI
jgi:hypothetical protein